ncbi:hypothetical protein LINPERHAP1_LOCUS28895 [Linum perenne]
MSMHTFDEVSMEESFFPLYVAITFCTGTLKKGTASLGVWLIQTPKAM